MSTLLQAFWENMSFRVYGGVGMGEYEFQGLWGCRNLGFRV